MRASRTLGFRYILAAALGCAGTASDAAETSGKFTVQINVGQSARMEAPMSIEPVTDGPPAGRMASGLSRTMKFAVQAPGARMRVAFAVVDPYVRTILVRGLGRQIEFGPEGGQVDIPLGEGRHPFEVGYSVRYHEGVGAGPRPAPLQLTIEVAF